MKDRDYLIESCCQLCVNAYYGEDGEVKNLFGEFKDHHISGVDFQTQVSGSMAYIVFQGSTDCGDWMDNLKFWKAKEENFGSGIWCHAGFVGQFNSIKDVIMQIASDNDVCEIIVCGHSLGGALAAITALFLSYCGNRNVRCVTFASPRVGNKKFSDECRSRVSEFYRVANKRDIVTRLPMYLLGYRHCGEKVTVDSRYRPGNIFKRIYHYIFGCIERHNIAEYKKAIDLYIEQFIKK